MPPQLEKNHVVPTAWQDEALARDGVSREVPCSALKGERIRKQYEENSVDLNSQEIQVALQEEIDKILSKCPLTLSLTRENYKENKEIIVIDSVKGDDGEDINIRNFKLEIQSLNDPECYWLDSGEFNINTVSNVNRELRE